MAPKPPTVEEIFADYRGRRTALIRALTEDVDEFYELCDPAKDNLCLYGYPNETWEVTLPEAELPAELPQPILGINFAKKGRDRGQWLSMVAAHSDSWLLSVAFYLGTHHNRNERERLFSLINDLPTVGEVVNNIKPIEEKPTVDSERSSDGQVKSNPKLADEGDEEDEDEHNETPSGNNNADEGYEEDEDEHNESLGGNGNADEGEEDKDEHNESLGGNGNADEGEEDKDEHNGSLGGNGNADEGEEDEDEHNESLGGNGNADEGEEGEIDIEDEDYEEDEETLCGSCGEIFSGDDYWISCYICGRLFHLECVNITPEEAESIQDYNCPSCI